MWNRRKVRRKEAHSCTLTRIPQAVSDVAGCLTQYKSVRQEREETLQKMESLRKK